MNRIVPVIAIDGPTASGKGTVASRVADSLGWHFLDSGSIYRLVSLQALRSGVAFDDAERLVKIASRLDVTFDGEEVVLDGEDVKDKLRQEEVGNGASKLAAIPAVRSALLDRQKGFRKGPGLVADGRDMGSVVFSDSVLKIFLTASVEARAERRYKQLIDKGLSANLERLVLDLRERDERDTNRAVAPLKPSADAVLLDTTALTADQAVIFVLEHARERLIESRFVSNASDKS
ncbi:(d)CMP kinase [Uliginosibacterium sp. H3]|uniref:Cytidylate kinase n=1 Tax=Uliginosibacterium silvisoli TaxID=3114758 RepID=A0ABU6K7Y5_9RHOO|nr:(d)CMP kinase [Uliginosibacterium sp. H3]